MILHPHFHFKSFPEKEWEREREEKAQIGEREREERAQIGEHRSSIAPLVDWWAVRSSNERARRLSPLVAVDRNWRRDRTARRSMSDAIGEIAIDGGDNWRVTAAKIEIAPSSPLSGFVFSFFFSKHQKIFFKKFFEMQLNTWKHFPSWKIAFPENGIFSRNAFTRTKHSLNGVLYEEKRVLLKHSWSYSTENQRKLMKKRKKETEWIES